MIKKISAIKFVLPVSLLLLSFSQTVFAEAMPIAKGDYSQDLLKKLDAPASNLVLGNTKNPKVIVVEFFDYNCSYCKHDYKFCEGLAKKYPDIQVVLKPLPLLSDSSKQAIVAVQAAAAQSKERGLAMHEAIMSSTGTLTTRRFDQFAKANHLDMVKFHQDMANSTAAEKLAADNKDEAEHLDVVAVPMIFIANSNGTQRYRWVNRPDAKQIDEILKGMGVQPKK